MRIGIIGTGRIAKRAVKEIMEVQGLKLAAVYNPNLQHAKEFAALTEGAMATSSLDEFVGEIDAAYIATPHALHYKYAKEMLLAGKHVLCEKPLTFNEDEAFELYDLAGDKKLVLMEAIKTAYCPGFKKIQEVVESGAIGDVVDVEAAFTRLTLPPCREFEVEAYGGSFTEFGSYTLLPIFRFMGTKYRDVQLRYIKAASGVDGYAKAEFVFGDMSGTDSDGGAAFGFATARTGLTAKSEGQLVITGTKGYVLVPSPWWLTKYFQVRHEDPGQIEEYRCEFEGDGLRYEFREFLKRAAGPYSKGQTEALSEDQLFYQKEKEEAVARAKTFEYVISKLYR
jgi:predicted dehydrogenase